MKEDVYVINLDRREDRWNLVNNEIMKKSKILNPIRFSALEGIPSWKYCALSHMAIVEMATEKNLPYVIVMEDDTVIRMDIFDEIFARIMFFLKNYHERWNIFNGNPSCLGNLPQQELKIVYPYPLLTQYQYGKTTNFLIYNKSCYQTILNLREKYLSQLLDDRQYTNLDYEKLAYDHLLCGTISGLKVITSLPYLTTQRDGFSDIEKASISYDLVILDHGMNFATQKLKNEGRIISGKLLGGLGNQMFVLATAFSAGIDSGRGLIFPKKNWEPCQYRSVNEYWNTFFKFLYLAFEFPGQVNRTVVDKENFQFHPFDVKGELKVIQLDGYFQHIGYFNKHRADICNFFQPNEEAVKTLYTKYSWLRSTKDVGQLPEKKVMIHVRQGDYVIKKNYHHNIPLRYYQKCLAEIKRKYAGVAQLKIVLFSDDISWCRQQNVFKNNVEIFVEGEKDYLELYMMMQFDVYILANSTFSWWGAYLSQGKVDTGDVYLPAKWLENGKYPDGLILDGLKKMTY